MHRAVGHLRQAVEERPTNATLHRLLGVAHLLAGDVDAGIEALDIACSFMPSWADDVEVDLLRLTLLNGEAPPMGNRFDGLLTRNVDNERHAGCIAAFHLAHQRFDQARAELIAARKRWPESLALQLDFAITLWTAGDAPSALYHFSVLHDEHAGRPWIEWNLIAALAATGNHAAVDRALADSSASVATDAELRALIGRSRRLNTPDPAMLSGDLSTVSLADILNLLWQCRSVGTLSVDSAAGQGGLHFWKGRLVGAFSPKSEQTPGRKSVTWLPPTRTSRSPLKKDGDPAMRRSEVYQEVRSALEEMLGWKTGRFEFQSRGQAAFPAVTSEVALETPVILLEACAQLDEKNKSLR